MGIIDTLRSEAENQPQEQQEAAVEHTQNEPSAPTEPAPQEPDTTSNEKNTGHHSDIDGDKDGAAPDAAAAEPETEGAPQESAPTPTKSFASEKAAKFDEFVRKTGKDDYKEFEFWQKPASELDETELLRKYLSEKEGMTEKEIAFELNRMTVPEKGGDDFDDDFGTGSEEISEKEILRERELRKARNWHAEEQQRIAGAEENAAKLPQRMTVEEYSRYAQEQSQQSYKQNLEKVYQTLPEVTGLKIKIPGNEKLGIAPLDVDYTPDEEFRNEMKATSEDIGVVINKFFDKGQLKDPKGWIETVATASPKNLQKIIQFAVEQAVQNDRIAQSNRRRNVTPDNYQSVAGGGASDEESFDEWRKNKNK